jgi:uncharacterized radical SAM protein YgiQ
MRYKRDKLENIVQINILGVFVQTLSSANIRITSQMDFLPLTKEEVQKKGWDNVDIVLVSGDAYVDHPAFGTAMIGRVLESQGYRVGIIAMPDWKNPNSMTVFGKPRLFFGVTSGNVDSMVANFTAFKMRRSDDPYVPGGKAGHKPNRTLIVYCNLIKQVYKDVPIVIGGIEASMRRFAHYDFWSDKVRRSILEDTRANILVYGMGEGAISEIANRISKKKELNEIEGTVFIAKQPPENAKLIPSEEEVLNSNEKFIEFYSQFYKHQNKILAQSAGKRYIIQYPSAQMSPAELDKLYELPFKRKPHPSYNAEIPAFKMITNSITAHRGCVSGCSFCSLTLHQGKRIISRSKQSILKEVEKVVATPGFKGHISDIGGPSANNYNFDCKINWLCNRESCTFPALCPNLELRTNDWIDLLERVSKAKGVKKVSIGSGIRFDLFMADPKSKQLLKKLIESHISGQLKIAPEHSQEKVLRAMRKKTLFPLKEFVQLFQKINISLKKRQHLIPYLMSNHPGSGIQEMKEMKKNIQSVFKFIPDQVQAFYPLPMTLSSVIYYTGVDPITKEKIFVEREHGLRRKQHRFFFGK